MEINLSIEQRQALSLKQTVSVHILHLGAYELKEYIEKETLENPIIEFIENQEYISAKQMVIPRNNFANSGFDPIEQMNGEQDTQSLIEYLLSQIKLSNLSFEEMKNAAAVCGFVESSGYILTDIKSIALQCNITLPKAENALEYIKSLDPQGVGAKDLSECLFLQLDEQSELEKIIVKNYIKEMAQNKILYIANQLKCDKEVINIAIEKIKALNPKPGNSLEKQGKSVFIMPDILLAVENGKISVSILKEKSLEITISPTYLDLLKTCKDQKTLQYIAKKLDRANWLRQCVESRNKTLLAVANEMVSIQKDFFTKPGGVLKPLKLEDIAHRLSIHSSTVSRAVKDKYIQYPGAIIPLKRLLVGKSLQDNNCGEISTHTVKQRIKQIIDSENKKAPFSDQKISDALKNENINCSRRTVAKYRDLMGIFSTNERKQF